MKKHFAILLLLAAGSLSYSNSFTGAFVFDDFDHIVENEKIHSVDAWMDLDSFTDRPVAYLTFAVNHALHGFHLWGYHFVNLLIHLFAGLTLFGILRRTFQTDRLKKRYGKDAIPLACIIALIWLVHPLQTESVTYVVQRMESLMGLFYLLTLYCMIRGSEAPKTGFGYGTSVLFCILGMATKQVMVTAPILVLLYDRLFLSECFKTIWSKRKSLYLGYLFSWFILGFLVVMKFKYAAPVTAGFAFEDHTATEYALTQPAVVLHYLRLVLWPDPLIFDYLWSVSSSFQQASSSIVLVSALIVLSVLGLKFYPSAGFLGVSFFLILLPTSSIMPIKDVAVEHRMYLPLIPVCVLFVAAAYLFLNGVAALFGTSAKGKKILWLSFVSVIAVILGSMTFKRNLAYASEISLWHDTALKRPENPRAFNNLGSAYFKDENFQEAITYFKKAIDLYPGYANPNYNLGLIYNKLGDRKNAFKHYTRVLEIEPDRDDAHYNLGILLFRSGKFEEAKRHFKAAFEANPEAADAFSNYALILHQEGKYKEAAQNYREAIRVDPMIPETHNNLGNTLVKMGELRKALSHYKEAIQIDPQYENARSNHDRVFAVLKKVTQAEGPSLIGAINEGRVSADIERQ